MSRCKYGQKRRRTSVRLFTFDNKPPQYLWNYYQLWVGGLVHGKGIYAIKPENKEEDRQMRLALRTIDGFTPTQVEDIMNFIYKKL